MNKKPFLYALGAAGYISLLVLSISALSKFVPAEDNIVMPIAGLSLFVLSAAIMGFLFLSEPLRLFLEGQKREAVTFFLKTVGFFACFVALFGILMFLV
jgi:hypothetical protein